MRTTVRIALAALLTLGAVAAPAVARAPVLNPPIDCVLGETCYIQNYVDTDPSGGAADFTCGALAYDGHKGTDFALFTQEDMRAGVDVLAAAPGTVRALRDGMADHLYGTPDAPDIAGKECGNGVVIDHGDGWSTQYCHLKQGSIAVIEGQRVGKTTVLGQVGLSGQTQFPHVHMSLRHNGEVVDPFNPDGVIACGAPRAETLWQDPIDYVAGGLISIGVTDHIPSYDAVKAGTADTAPLTAQAPALVVFALGFGAQPDDVVALELRDPQGAAVFTQNVTLTKTQALYFRAAGKKGADWPDGTYVATARLIRNGTQIDSTTQVITITP